MGSFRPPLPQWTWEDVEAVLALYGPRGLEDPVNAHLMQGLVAEAVEAGPRALLNQIIDTAWVMAQLEAKRRVSAIDLRQGERASVS